MQVELEEALVLIYKGQSNVALLAEQLGMPIETLKQEFRDYVSRTPIDPDVALGDVELSWPFVC